MSETTTTPAPVAAPSPGGGGGGANNEIRYLTPISIETTKEKYCRFKKLGITYVDYKDEQGKILPRRLTGTSQKFQKKVAQAVKRSRHLALMPYVADMMK
jgi:small subunit ribosomal protein S18